ncbi:terminase large subunit domain-containing protein [Prosthecomicrobium hirschii]|uniref:terminase large subunit domain-containing protein n=1 Tax=Prosthecodimorpha hirschii TaxID=665126 RepID=UPI002220255F|nr:terminase family protein [Prosthecomicrobium hirschii]MCW1842288.1 hypothetical protein [Prosthecomicrobium hirschii]
MTMAITQAEWARLRREALETVPAAFADGRLPDLLIPYQARGLALLDSASTRVLVVEKSRRIGYTWGLAAYAVLRAGRAKEARGTDVMYISYSQEMTREFVDAAAMWARAFAVAAATEEEFLFEDADPADPAETRQIKAFRIRFASGFEVIALSSAPRSLRGKQGVVIIDEAAFVESLAELLKAALAFLMWGGQVVVVSTHNGADNPFNGLVQDILSGRKPYHHLRIDFDDALQDGLYQRICLVKGEAWTPEGEAAWRAEIVSFYAEGADEELFCVPSQGEGAWLPGTLIEARMRPDIPILRWDLPADYLARPAAERRGMVAAFMIELDRVLATLDPDLRHAAGFDFGRHVDLSMLWVLATTRTVRRRTALVLEMRRVPYDEQKAVVLHILRRLPRFGGAHFDATGSGEYIAEAAVREISSVTCVPVKITTEWYRTAGPPLKAAFEDDQIEIPRDAQTLDDFRLIRVIRGVAQVPATRTGEKGAKRHGDGFVACLMAYEASRTGLGEYDYVSATDLEREGRRGHHGGPPIDDDMPGFGRRLWG